MKRGNINMYRANSYIAPSNGRQSTRASASKNSAPTARTRQSPKKRPAEPNIVLTLRVLLGTGLEGAKSWCSGFAHGTYYDAFLGMIRSENPAILPYKDLGKNLPGSGRRTEWQKQGVFFRIVKKTKRIINSVESTGSSGGVILFMPIDKSLDLKLYSLSVTDTLTEQGPVTPHKKVFDSLKLSGNLSMAEITFGEGIPLSYISEVFLINKKWMATQRAEASAWLCENGFQKKKNVENSRGEYQHFVRQSSESSPSSRRSVES